MQGVRRALDTARGDTKTWQLVAALSMLAGIFLARTILQLAVLASLEIVCYDGSVFIYILPALGVIPGRFEHADVSMPCHGLHPISYKKV